MSSSFPSTARTRVNRAKKRATYDGDLIREIIDSAYVGTVAISRADGPHCQPMIVVRDGDQIILHGNPKNALLDHLSEGNEACVNISLIDGLRLGKTIPNHSFNYRSVNIYGRAIECSDRQEKLSLMQRVFDHIAPDRWHLLPPLDAGYLDFVRVFALPLAECVAKVMAGPVEEDGPDNPQLWYGVLPMHTAFSTPQPGQQCTAPSPTAVPRLR